MKKRSFKQMMALALSFAMTITCLQIPVPAALPESDEADELQEILPVRLLLRRMVQCHKIL